MYILSIQVGRPKPMLYQGREIMTGIRKQPVEDELYLAAINFNGDNQADLENHGGPDKAVCVYCREHYAHWEQLLGRPLAFGAFGENLTVTGMTEADVHIGDTFQIGEAVVQVTQPRGPCYKLGQLHQLPELPAYVQETGFTGYYMRVLQEGRVAPRSIVSRIENHPQQITVDFVNRIKYHDRENAEAIRRILAVAELSKAWRESFERRLTELASG